MKGPPPSNFALTFPRGDCVHLNFLDAFSPLTSYLPSKGHLPQVCPDAPLKGTHWVQLNFPDALFNRFVITLLQLPALEPACSMGILDGPPLFCWRIGFTMIMASGIVPLIIVWRWEREDRAKFLSVRASARARYLMQLSSVGPSL